MHNRNGVKIAPNEKVTEAVSVILNELNAMGSDRKQAVAAAIYDRVTREHRTLQQSFWNAVLQAQMEYASETFDLRNEAAVKLANVVKAAARDANFDLGLPNI